MTVAAATAGLEDRSPLVHRHSQQGQRGHCAWEKKHGAECLLAKSARLPVSTRAGASDNIAPGSARGIRRWWMLRPRRRSLQPQPSCQDLVAAAFAAADSSTPKYPAPSAGLSCFARLRAQRATTGSSIRTCAEIARSEFPSSLILCMNRAISSHPLRMKGKGSSQSGIMV